MKRILFLLVLVAKDVLADPVLKNGGTVIGPITSINCVIDGGVSCGRVAGATGNFWCATATASEPGCIVPTAQTFSGNKTFTGQVTAQVLDSGVAIIGSQRFAGAQQINEDGNNTFLMQSNTADAITTSTVPAMKFKLGAAITGADLGWLMEDSSGNRRFSVTAAGTANFVALATDTGAATVAGTNFTAQLGAGGQGSGAVAGGAGGTLSVTAGAGGAASTGAGGAAIGGAASITAGTGGAASSISGGAAGGAATLQAGAGGADNAALGGGNGGAVSVLGGAAGAGGIGGAVTITAGRGGDANASHALNGGGPVTITAGKSGTSAAGGGGSIAGGTTIIAAGAGSDGVSGSDIAGPGGDLVLKSGAAGAAFSSGTGWAGNVTLDTGTTTGSPGATGALVNIGTTNATTIAVGRSGQALNVTSGFVRLGATNLLMAATAPTISSGFGTSPSVTTSNGTVAFTINVGTGGSASSGVIAFSNIATNGWFCYCTDLTTFSSTVFLTRMTASTTNNCTVGNFSSAAAGMAWVASDILHCIAVPR